MDEDEGGVHEDDDGYILIKPESSDTIVSPMAHVAIQEQFSVIQRHAINLMPQFGIV
eukprot:CAMPEP_0197826618 /NCGR_PEP_ID=MMETSP1437-20131217/3559_1 /TAXON_ID=49252 ORGANISM="Eucampia antarctica, Strain CCMP1452" /NCGR_SAMPLE_ID=MMETSP1437 /ASSEMBLY_ACC=CAM_ASM_001096 /LENGTH=56 /DNA_ID=CAMNT_0043427133 /DNA_START=120 /DNA_END=287 /DNA_ORIENTATION=+